jgi:hypothetical protein
MYRTHCERAKPRDCTKRRFYRLPQLPLDITALAGFLQCYTTEVRVSDKIVCTLIKYKQMESNTTQLMILLRCILTLLFSTTYFGSSYEPSSGRLLFLSKVKYTISNAFVIVAYEISYNK